MEPPRCAFVPQGRFGNAVFQYIACKLFCLAYDYQYVATPGDLKNPLLTIFESVADVQWKTVDTPQIRIQQVPADVNMCLMEDDDERDVLIHGFFQNMALVNESYETIRGFLTAENTDRINPTTRVCDLIQSVSPLRDVSLPSVVIHVRLDDFYNAGNGSNVLPLAYYEKGLYYLRKHLKQKQKQTQECNRETIPVWIVTDALRTEKEKAYVKELMASVRYYGFPLVQMHQRSLMDDWAMCRDATYILSSNSTFALTAVVVGRPLVAILPDTGYYPHQVIEPLNHIPTCLVWDTRVK